MTGLQQREWDPQPLARGGELALVALAGVVVLAGAPALVGLGLAGLVFGGGWVRPAGRTVAVLSGLLHGRPGAGLAPEQAALLPGPVAVYGCVALAELTTAGLATVVGVVGWRYRRPGDARRGMATRQQAQQVLGVSRLHAARRILRPDLHSPRAARRRPVDASPTSAGPDPVGNAASGGGAW